MRQHDAKILFYEIYRDYKGQPKEQLLDIPIGPVPFDYAYDTFWDLERRILKRIEELGVWPGDCRVEIKHGDKGSDYYCEVRWGRQRRNRPQKLKVLIDKAKEEKDAKEEKAKKEAGRGRRRGGGC